MLRPVLILAIVILFNKKSVSQEASQPDSAIQTFTLTWSAKNDGSCNPPAVYPIKFQVLKSSSDKFFLSVYISQEDWPFVGVNKFGNYIAKGILAEKDYKIYGCFSAFYENKRLFIKPQNITYDTY